MNQDPNRPYGDPTGDHPLSWHGQPSMSQGMPSMSQGMSQNAPNGPPHPGSMSGMSQNLGFGMPPPGMPTSLGMDGGMSQSALSQMSQQYGTQSLLSQSLVGDIRPMSHGMARPTRKSQNPGIGSIPQGMQMSQMSQNFNPPHHMMGQSGPMSQGSDMSQQGMGPPRGYPGGGPPSMRMPLPQNMPMSQSMSMSQSMPMSQNLPMSPPMSQQMSRPGGGMGYGRGGWAGYGGEVRTRMPYAMSQSQVPKDVRMRAPQELTAKKCVEFLRNRGYLRSAQTLVFEGVLNKLGSGATCDDAPVDSKSSLAVFQEACYLVRTCAIEDQSDAGDVIFAIALEMWYRLFSVNADEARLFMEEVIPRIPRHTEVLKSTLEITTEHELEVNPVTKRLLSPFDALVIPISKRAYRALHQRLLASESLYLLDVVCRRINFEVGVPVRRDLILTSSENQSVAAINKTVIPWGLPDGPPVNTKITQRVPSRFPRRADGEATELLTEKSPLYPTPDNPLIEQRNGFLLPSYETQDILNTDNLPSTLACILSDSFTNPVTSMFLQDALVATTHQYNDIVIWNSKHKQCHHLLGHESTPLCTAVSQDSTYMVSGALDGEVIFWSLEKERPLSVYGGIRQAVWDVDMDPFSRHMCIGSADRTARLFDISKSCPIRIFVGHNSDVEAVRFHPNLSLVVSGSADATIRMWDVRSGELSRVLLGHALGVSQISISPNGKFVASADKNRIYVWDIPSGSQLHSMDARDSVTSLDFCHGSNLLVGGTSNGHFYIWDITGVESPKPLTAVYSQQLENTCIRAAKFTRDNLLVIGGVETFV